MSNGLFVHLRSSFSLLNRQQKKEGGRLCIATILNVIFDLFSLVSILPALYIVAGKDKEEQPEIINQLYTLSGVTDIEKLTYLIILAVLLFFIFKTFFSYGVIRWRALFASGIAIGLSNKIYNANLGKAHQKNAGEDIVNIVNIPYTFISKTVNAAFDLISKSVLVVVVFGSLAIYNAEALLYLTLILIPVALLYVRLSSKHLDSIRKSLEKYQPSLTQSALESLNGKIEIIISGNKEYFFRDFLKVNTRYGKTLAQLNISVNSSAKFIELIALTGILILFAYATAADFSKDNTFFILTIYSISAYKLIPSLNGINVAYTIE